MIDTYSDRPRKSSVIFGDLQKCLENVRKTFVCPSDNVGESSEIFVVRSEKLSQTSLLVCLGIAEI